MTTAFELPAELTIYCALEVRDALLAWATEQGANTKNSLEISAAQVGVIDGAGLQLLAAVSNMERDWRLLDASAVFVEACKTMGLEHWLDKYTRITDAVGV